MSVAMQLMNLLPPSGNLFLLQQGNQKEPALLVQVLNSENWEDGIYQISHVFFRFCKGYCQVSVV